MHCHAKVHISSLPCSPQPLCSPLDFTPSLKAYCSPRVTEKLCDTIGDAHINKDDQETPNKMKWLHRMTGGEISMVAWATFVLSSPSYAVTSILSIMALQLNSTLGSSP